MLLLVGLAQTAQATDLPKLYDVSGVASDDTLNVRSGPGTGNPVVGELAFNERDVEVVALSDSGSWGLIGQGEGPGWVSMRFLREVPGQSAIPEPLYCSGTEPFWLLDIHPGTATFEALSDGGPMNMNVIWNGTAMRPDQFGYALRAPAARASVTAQREECSDGMSDRVYGISVNVLLLRAGNGTLFSGCCNLAR